MDKIDCTCMKEKFEVKPSFQRLPKDDEYQPWQRKWCSYWLFEGTLVKVIDWDYERHLNVCEWGFDGDVKLGWGERLKRFHASSEQLKPFEGVIKAVMSLKGEQSVTRTDVYTKGQYVDIQCGYYVKKFIGTLKELHEYETMLIKSGVKLIDTSIHQHYEQNTLSTQASS